MNNIPHYKPQRMHRYIRQDPLVVYEVTFGVLGIVQLSRKFDIREHFQPVKHSLQSSTPCLINQFICHPFYRRAF